MKLKGTTRIELTDVNTGEVSVVEKENMMTNVLHNFFNYNPMGVFNTLVNTRTIKMFNSNFAHDFYLCTLKIQYLAVIQLSIFRFLCRL